MSVEVSWTIPSGQFSFLILIKGDVIDQGSQ